MIDANGYPTDEALEMITNAESAKEAFDLAVQLWWPSNATFSELRPEEAAVAGEHPYVERYMRFTTGGWSGNESIIQALKENFRTYLYWCFSARGGLHIYGYPKEGMP